jgi:hypothetical protein
MLSVHRKSTFEFVDIHKDAQNPVRRHLVDFADFDEQITAQIKPLHCQEGALALL